MIKQDVLKLMDERIDTTEYDNDYAFDEYIDRIIELLGDDEEEILEFMDTAETKYVSYFDEFYEEIIAKFPSDEMEAMFEKYR